MDKRKLYGRYSLDDGYSKENLSNASLISMLRKLENNHRRLLGVTSALTEALENTVRGNTYELEETLNKCIDIYPELFTVTIKKPSKNNIFRKTYNTSVSEDVTDPGDNEIKTYPSFRIQSDADQSTDGMGIRTKRPFSFSKETHKKHSQVTESKTKVPEHTFKKHKTPKSTHVKYRKPHEHDVNKEPSFEILLNPNDCQKRCNKIKDNHSPNRSPTFPSLSPDFKNDGFSSLLSENESLVFITPVTEMEFNLNPTNKQTQKSESSYTVKHPESDTDYSTHRRHFNLDTDYEKNISTTKSINLNLDHTEPEQDSSADNNNNSSVPYEIIVQKKAWQRDDENNTELSIKIIPEGNDDQDDSMIQQESHSPMETCIIIKQQFSPNFRGPNKYQIENTGEEVIFNGPAERISVTIAKLQSLSTGLQVQSGVLQPIQENTSAKQGISNKENISNNFEYPTKIALLNSYDTSSPKPKDPSDEIRYDFVCIKKKLIEGSVKECSQILQSLRLNLIHTLATERSALLQSYIDNDIFDIYSNPTLIEILMPKEIINGWDLILQQTILKFLNTLGSMWKGRDYLAGNLKTFNILQKYFFDKYSMRVSSENTCKDMLVAVFHKLSTRQSQQIALINAGVSEKILFSVLENAGTISAYRLLHSLGLLINLCVNSQGRQLMEPMSSELLTLLQTLLGSKEKKIVSYAARLLYILMASDKFHKEANKMDIIKVLKEAMKTPNKRIKLQLELLKSAVEEPLAHNHLNDAEEEFLRNIEAEVDELEEEVEIGEPGVTHTQSESYKKPGMPTTILMNEDNKISQECAKKETKSKQKEPEIPQKDGDDLTKPDMSVVDVNFFFDKLKEKDKSNSLSAKRDKDTDSLLSSNFALFKEALDNIIDDQTSYNIIPESVSEKMLENKNEKHDEKINLADRAESLFREVTMDKDNQTDISNKQIKPSSLTIEMKNTKEEVKATTPPGDLKEDKSTPLTVKTEMAPSKSRPPSQKSDHITQRSRKHSIYSLDGTNDYEYCEETKQIHVPVKQNNIFADCRQSPYKNRFSDPQKEVLKKTQETIISSSNAEKTSQSGSTKEND